MAKLQLVQYKMSSRPIFISIINQKIKYELKNVCKVFQLEIGRNVKSSNKKVLIYIIYSPQNVTWQQNN